jgi:hypothetical protein
MPETIKSKTKLANARHKKKLDKKNVNARSMAVMDIKNVGYCFIIINHSHHFFFNNYNFP